MPSSTFFNLPEDKKERLLSAAEREFSRVTFDKASINKIIQQAGISRGSFYMYFEDKKDLLRHILSSDQEKISSILYDSMQGCGGDIFTAFQDVFHYMTEDEALCKKFAIIRNAIIASFMTDTGDGYGFSPEDKKNFLLNFNKLVQCCNTDNLKLKEDGDFEIIVDLLVYVTRRALLELLRGAEPTEAVEQRFQKGLLYIKTGAYKNPSENMQ